MVANYASSPDKSLITGPNRLDLSVANQKDLDLEVPESPSFSNGHSWVLDKGTDLNMSRFK